MDQDRDRYETDIEHGHGDYTAEELLEHAQSNAQAAIIATAAFLHERGVSLDDWASALGRLFSRGWDAPRPWDAGEFMDAMLTNFRALGAEVRSVDLQPDRADAVTLRFPDPTLCTLFGVEPGLPARFNEATTVIAAERGLTWTWTVDGDETRYTATRASS